MIFSCPLCHRVNSTSPLPQDMEKAVFQDSVTCYHCGAVYRVSMVLLHPGDKEKVNTSHAETYCQNLINGRRCLTRIPLPKKICPLCEESIDKAKTSLAPKPNEVKTETT